MRRDIPQPPELGLLNALRFGRDPLRFLEAVQARYPDAVEVPVPGRPPLVILTNPDLVHDALSRPEAFTRPSANVGLPAERGLVQSEGDLWRQQRSVMLPAFLGRQVVAYGDVAGERGAALADRLGRAADAGRPVDLHRELTTLTIRVASEILLGTDVGVDAAGEFHDWMRAATDELEISPRGVLPDWVPLSSSSDYDAAAASMQAFSQDIIDRRRATMDRARADGGRADATTDSGSAAGSGSPPGSDMLSLLLAAEDDPDVSLPPNQIRDEVVTFLVAGHETTALSITYTLSLLSKHPEVRERVRAEAREVLGDEPPRYEHLDDLPYTTRVFREALRLYPAAWAVFREAAGEVRLGDYRVKDGSAMILPQYSIHRDGRYFENPGTFDPSRWERRDPNALDAYFPFGSGPHACIGRQFALAGGVLTTAGVTRGYDLDVDWSALEDLQATITLRPRDGVPTTVSRAAE